MVNAPRESPSISFVHRNDHCVTTSALIKLYCLSLCLVGAFALNEDVFEITAPSFGDTVTVSKYTTDGVAVPIEWTVPDALADKPVMISLVQGNDLSSLDRIAQINGVSSHVSLPSFVTKC
jgi:hypothetical protein